MAKSLRKLKDPTANEVSPVGPTNEGQSSVSPSLSEKAPAAKPAKVATKFKSKRSSAETRKTSANTKPRKAQASKKSTRRGVEISDDDIRLRAYFISQQRNESGLAGDSASDWLEAKRQVLAEAADHA